MAHFDIIAHHADPLSERLYSLRFLQIIINKSINCIIHELYNCGLKSLLFLQGFRRKLQTLLIYLQ